VSGTGTRPDAELEGVDRAFALLAAAIAPLTDEDARGQSRLPGWSRGHVLTHIARNADGLRRIVEGVARDEVVDQYPGGAEQRTNEIEAGADRSVAELRADVVETNGLLVAAWADLPDGTWDRMMHARTGLVPARAGVTRRWREVLVHLVDLDAGVGAGDLPPDYVAHDHDWLAANRTRPTWPDTPR
jgi:maleylpyruvate isomerase